MTFLSKFSFGLGALIVCAASQTSFAAETVTLNKTHVMRLNGSAASIIVGNPEIADVSVFSNETILLFGRGYGETDILVLDEYGNTLVHTDVHVIENKGSSKVSLISGDAANRRTYSCRPYCQPSPTLGDESGFKGEFSGAISGGSAGQSAVLIEQYAEDSIYGSLENAPALTGGPQSSIPAPPQMQ